jgi:cullin 3
MPNTNIIRKLKAGLAGSNNDVDFEETWTVISSSLKEMHTKNASQLSFETIYRHGYKIVLKKKGEVFYERLQKFEQDWLTDQVQEGLRTLVSPSLLNKAATGNATTVNEKRSAGERFLKGIKEAFEDHQLVMNMATDVFMYLVRRGITLNLYWPA